MLCSARFLPSGLVKDSSSWDDVWLFSVGSLYQITVSMDNLIHSLGGVSMVTHQDYLTAQERVQAEEWYTQIA